MQTQIGDVRIKALVYECHVCPFPCELKIGVREDVKDNKIHNHPCAYFPSLTTDWKRPVS